jgi:hypothetical protein
VRKVRRIVYPILFLTVSLILALFYPMLLLIFYAGAFVLLLLARQLNFYKMLMVLKQYARDVGSKLRFEIRARLHLGFRDYSRVSVDADEELRRRNHGYIR